MAKTTRGGGPGREVARELQGALVDLVRLSLLAKQAHWNVTGPLFEPLHAAFDRMAEEYRGWYDAVAERIRALGEPADGRPGALASSRVVEDLPAGEIRDRDAVEAMRERIEALSGRLRGRLDFLGERDPVTQDMAIGILEGLEKQAWMLRAQAR